MLYYASVKRAVHGRVLCGSPDPRATTRDDLIIIHADIIRLPPCYVHYNTTRIAVITI